MVVPVGSMRPGRLQPFLFMFSDDVARTFYALTYDQALEYAKTWGRSHGGLTVTPETTTEREGVGAP